MGPVRTQSLSVGSVIPQAAMRAGGEVRDALKILVPAG